MELINYLSQTLQVQHALIILGCAFGLSLIGITAFWISLRFEFHRITNDLKGVVAGSEHINHENYDRLNERMRKSRLLAHAWNEFDETVIRDDSEEQIQIYNIKSFGEFIPTEPFLEQHMNVSLFRKIPAILTSLGLFFTFLFIIFGLMHLHPLPSGKIEGVKGLIEGLSAKFESSVLAIMLSIAFTLIEGWVIRSVEHARQDLVELLDIKFQKKTSEDYLRNIDRSMRDLNLSMKRFSTDLAGVIKEGLQEGMRPSTDRLLVAIENLEKQKSENIADTLSKLLGEFKASLNQSAGNEFEALNNGIAKLVKVMNESTDRSEVMSSRMDGLVKAIDSQLQRQEQSSEESVQKLQGGFKHLLDSIEKNTQAQNENLNRILSDIISKTSSATDGLISNVESLSQKNSGLVSGFNNLNENISKSVEKYQEAVQSTKTLIQSTSDLASNLGGTVKQMASIQSQIDETFQHFLRETSVVQGIQKENAESVTRYREVFQEVEKGLGTILDQIGDNLRRYNDLTRTGLEGYLKQYDDSLSTATTKLSSTVKDLDDVLENFGDQIEEIHNAVKPKAG